MDPYESLESEPIFRNRFGTEFMIESLSSF